MAKPITIAAFRASLSPQDLGAVDKLRALAAGAAEGVTEHIKWNAPSFCRGGDDRITLGLNRGGGFRAVLHRGAKPSMTDGFTFADPDGLAQWPAADRGVLSFSDLPEILEKEAAIADIFRRWMAATVP